MVRDGVPDALTGDGVPDPLTGDTGDGDDEPVTLVVPDAVLASVGVGDWGEPPPFQTQLLASPIGPSHVTSGEST